MGLDPGNAVPQRFDVPWLTLSCVFTVLACTTAARAQEVVPPALPVCPQTIAGSPVGAMGADAVPAMPRQPARARWEVEFYGSLALRGGSREGILDLTPVGDPFNTTVGSLPSHRVPSWFFGDGAVLLNDSLAALPDPAAARIVPLDPLLTSSVAAPRRFGGLGVRLIRLVGRNAIELDIAYGSGIAVANAREQAEQTRLTFEQSSPRARTENCSRARPRASCSPIRARRYSSAIRMRRRRRWPRSSSHLPSCLRQDPQALCSSPWVTCGASRLPATSRTVNTP
jgi:hypothetical protein